MYEYLTKWENERKEDEIAIKEIFAPFQFRTRVYPLRVRRFVYWATAARHIDFMFVLSICRPDNALAFITKYFHQKVISGRRK